MFTMLSIFVCVKQVDMIWAVKKRTKQKKLTKHIANTTTKTKLCFVGVDIKKEEGESKEET